MARSVNPQVGNRNTGPYKGVDMSISLLHHHGRAVVLHDGPLTWTASLELVDKLELAIEMYFYTTVELVVSSPGGVTGALVYVLNALERWRENGVHFRTRVIYAAASAAAILVCTGDERIAEPGAILLFHDVKAIDTGPLSARESADLHRVLREADEGLIALLVDRAVRGASGGQPNRFSAEDSDRPVLEFLQSALELPSNGRKPRAVRTLARVVGNAVAKAARANDRATLGLVYRRLAQLDRTISASLALTLRLIDRIGPSEAGEHRSADNPGLVIPQWRALHPPHGDVPREMLTRHTLVLGETGSGKTASAILPVVSALAKAPGGAVGAALIIDPKRELAPALEQLAPGRLRHVRSDQVTLNVMGGPRWCLKEHLAAKRWFSAASLILHRVASFVPTSPARVLVSHPVGDSNSEFFNREGTELALCTLAFILMVTSPDAPPPQEWLGSDPDALEFLEMLLDHARGTPDAPGPNAVALTAWALDGPLLSYPHSDGTIRIGPDTGRSEANRDKRWLFTRLACAATRIWAAEPSEADDLLVRIIVYWTEMVRIDRQFAGVRATARVVCSEFASPSIAKSVYFGCEPGYHSSLALHETIDFARAVGRTGTGELVLFQPSRDGLDSLIAVVLKGTFFESVLDDPDRARGDPSLPLVAYVSDEFHHYITSDPVHGEQSFLDTCRSFGAFCVLASQSLAALEHALASHGGNSTQNESSIDILFTNTSNKLLFRTTDPKTGSRLNDLCPTRPGHPPVSEVPAALDAGSR